MDAHNLSPIECLEQALKQIKEENNRSMSPYFGKLSSLISKYESSIMALKEASISMNRPHSNYPYPTLIEPVYDGETTAVKNYRVVGQDGCVPYELFRGTWDDCMKYQNTYLLATSEL